MTITIKMSVTAEELREINGTDYNAKRWENVPIIPIDMIPPQSPACYPTNEIPAIKQEVVVPCPAVKKPVAAITLDKNIIVNRTVGIDCRYKNADIEQINHHYKRYYIDDILEVDSNNIPIFSWSSKITFPYVVQKIEETVLIYGEELFKKLITISDTNQKDLINAQLKSLKFNIPYIAWLLRTVVIRCCGKLYIKDDDEDGSITLKPITVKTYNDYMNGLSEAAHKTFNYMTKIFGFLCFDVNDIVFKPSMPNIWTRKINGLNMNYCNKYHGVKYAAIPSESTRLPTDASELHYIYRQACEESNIARFILETMTFERSDMAKYFFGYHRLLTKGARVPCIVICVGPQGTGKTTIMLDLPRAVLGNEYVTSINDTAHVTGMFDSIIEEKIAIGFDDSKPLNMKEAQVFSTKCKSLSTNKTTTTVKKFQDAKNTVMTATIIVLSNSIECFYIEKGCRRTYCLASNFHQGGWMLQDVKHPERLDKSVHIRLQQGGYMSGQEVTQYIGELINGMEHDGLPCDGAIQSYLNYINKKDIHNETNRYKTEPPYTNLKRDMRFKYMSDIEKFVYNVIYYGCQGSFAKKADECPIGWDYKNNWVQVSCNELLKSDQLYQLYLAWFSWNSTGKHVMVDYEELKSKGFMPLTLKSFQTDLVRYATHYKSDGKVESGKLYMMKNYTRGGVEVKGSTKYFIVPGEVSNIAVELCHEDIKMEYDCKNIPSDITFESDIEFIDGMVLRENNAEPNFITRTKLEDVSTEESTPDVKSKLSTMTKEQKLAMIELLMSSLN